MKSLVLIGLPIAVALALWQGPAVGGTIYCNFNDTAFQYIGKGSDPPTTWREGDSQGSATVVDRQVRLTGNGSTLISGGLIRYNDINDVLDGNPSPGRPVLPDLSLEFTIPDFNVLRAFPLDAYPNLTLGVLTSNVGYYGVHRDSAGVWTFAGCWAAASPLVWTTGELIPGNVTRVSVKMVRTGDIISLYRAYDEDATTETPEGFLLEGNFQPALENYQLVPQEKGYYSIRIVMFGAVAGFVGTCYIDDTVLTGPYVPSETFPGVTDWPSLEIASNPPSGNGWYEVGERFEVSVSPLNGIDPPEFQWLWSETYGKTPAEIHGANSRSFVIDSLSLNDSGWYCCRVSNAQAKAVLHSDPVPVSVYPEGSLPALGAAGLCIAALLSGATGVFALRRSRSLQSPD